MTEANSTANTCFNVLSSKLPQLKDWRKEHKQIQKSIVSERKSEDSAQKFCQQYSVIDVVGGP